MTYRVKIELAETLPEDKELVIYAPASTTVLKNLGDTVDVYGWMENDIMIKERQRDSVEK